MIDKKWLDCSAFFDLIIKAKPLSFINVSLEREREREILGKQIKLSQSPTFLELKQLKFSNFQSNAGKMQLKRGFEYFFNYFCLC